MDRGATTELADALDLPARRIPVPAGLSPQARAILTPGEMIDDAAFPAPDDVEGWRAVAAFTDEMMLVPFLTLLAGDTSEVETKRFGGVPVHVVVPSGLRPEYRERVVLELHGGGFVFGGGQTCAAMCTWAARRYEAPVWAVDYRMAPDHPHPAALDDCLSVYRALLEQRPPEHIIVSGVSAGGNLAAGLVLRARDEGLPLPKAVLLMTPSTDLSESGDSYQTLLGIDSVITGSLTALIALYAAGQDLRDPSVSPLFAEIPGDFPPTLLQSGTRDRLLSDTVRMHRSLRAAGVPAELHVFEAMPHGGFIGAPEDDELDAEVRRFLAAQWPTN